ncbi:unnamed protein product [Toxocara canis]|uniref:PID domain-containing protein n=1 Tax=Toxocara canis TaxID=6265 RepID=A0A183V2U0_TOXCA|nr:unnamed protein product [Toxocara canis]
MDDSFDYNSKEIPIACEMGYHSLRCQVFEHNVDMDREPGQMLSSGDSEQHKWRDGFVLRVHRVPGGQLVVSNGIHAKPVEYL